MKHLLSFKKELGTLTSAINRRSTKQKKRGGTAGFTILLGLIACAGAVTLSNFQGKVMMTVNATDVTDVITIPTAAGKNLCICEGYGRRIPL
uniref:Polyprotein n=1 Tax=West Nile virus TaxID=11082 RepID=A0A513WXX9_WNV|nr:polyprotein [West Nile virus]